ncbi:MAG: SoxR reducing system RseC family protein [Bacteroidales bacterium]|nr:SoxR reducing system RseC family protein [Bacteroidales bacterium]
MNNRDTIRHPGTIVNVKNNKVEVKILNQSACANCHVKGMCNVAEMEEKIVEVPKPPHKEYREGERVEILMERSLGARAVLIGYFLPFLLFLATLIISLQLVSSEGFAALIALGILIPYYLILAQNQESIKKTFSFRLE